MAGVAGQQNAAPPWGFACLVDFVESTSRTGSMFLLSRPDATPLGLMDFLVRCPGVGFTALCQPRAKIRNPVGVDGSSSPMGIRILAQGCRSETEATLGTPPPGYPNPNGVASVPESIPDVFLTERHPLLPP